MNHRLGFFLVAMFMAAALSVTNGCTAVRNLRIEPVDHPGTLIEPQFKNAYYRTDRDKTMFFVMQNHAIDRATGQPVDQVVMVRMFWRPIGGKTTMNEEALNATFRYLVMTPAAVGMYEGAGFVRIYSKVGSGHLTARIIDGDMRLTEATANFNDGLGRSRLRGNFTCKLSDVKTFDMMAQARRDFFTRSMALAGAKDVTTTSPAATEPDMTRPNANIPFP